MIAHVSTLKSNCLHPWLIDSSHIFLENLVLVNRAILDNEVLLGILFNGTMEINISVIALFAFYQSAKNLR